MSARANPLIFTLGLSVTLLSCGQENDDDGEPNTGVPVGMTETDTSPTPSEPGDEPASCFTDAECDEGRYCEASDPSSSPEGRCGRPRPRTAYALPPQRGVSFRALCIRALHTRPYKIHVWGTTHVKCMARTRPVCHRARCLS